MTIKIDKPIVGYNVVKEEEQAEQATAQAADTSAKADTVKADTVKTETKATSAPAETKGKAKSEEGSNVVHMHEKVKRPETLMGATYKIRTPLSEHSLYVTINDIILNAGTEHELRRPFEIFINSKNMDHFQWIVALTRIISAVFRKGGDVTFLVDELRSVFDPRGGYFKKGGKYMPSLVAEIGDAIESHLIAIGLLKPEGFSEHQQKILEEKRAEFEKAKKVETEEDCGESDFPSGASLCKKCNTKAVIRMDGCNTCLNCGDSKCG